MRGPFGADLVPLGRSLALGQEQAFRFPNRSRGVTRARVIQEYGRSVSSSCGNGPWGTFCGEAWAARYDLGAPHRAPILRANGAAYASPGQRPEYRAEKGIEPCRGGLIGGPHRALFHDMGALWGAPARRAGPPPTMRRGLLTAKRTHPRNETPEAKENGSSPVLIRKKGPLGSFQLPVLG